MRDTLQLIPLPQNLAVGKIGVTITFNEMHSSMYDMRLGMKDYSLYDLEAEKHYTSNGNLKGGDNDTSEMEIIHEDWAFMRELDGFVPSYYKVEDGVYEARAHVCNARVWGVTFKMPDNPVAILILIALKVSLPTMTVL